MHKIKEVIKKRKYPMLMMSVAVAISLASTGCSSKSGIPNASVEKDELDNNEKQHTSAESNQSNPTQIAEIPTATPIPEPTEEPMIELKSLPEDMFEYRVLDEDEGEGEGVIISGLKYGGPVIEGILPSEIDGLPVVGVSESAFDQKNSITSIVIKNGVNRIDNEAFQYCNSLISIEFPETLLSIGEHAFYCCINLRTVKIPGSVLRIERQAFDYCEKLSSVELAPGVGSIGYKAFTQCENLRKLTIPESVESIGADLFDNGTQVMILTPTGSYAEQWAKKNAYTYNNITLLDQAPILVSDELLPEDLFVYEPYGEGIKITGVTSENRSINGVIPSTIDGLPVVSIRQNAFDEENSSVKITIADGVTTLGSFEVTSLRSIVIPDSVTEIEQYAFQFCYNLVSVRLPQNLTCINSSVFNGCYNLQSITIPDGVTTIGSDAFRSCISLSSINIPDSVTYIGDCAFKDCFNLSNVKLSKNITSIEYSTFSDCKSLGNIIIPEGVTCINDSAFYECNSLSTVELPNSLTVIDDYAFKGNCIANIKIPNGITELTNDSFYSFDYLETIEIPSSVTSINESAFNRWSNKFKNIITPSGSYAEEWARENDIPVANK